MCEPVTISMAAVAVASAAYAGYKQHQQGKYEEAAASQNIKYADAAAADALQRGADEEGAVRSDGTRMVAEQKVAVASSGVELQSGSALDAMLDTRLLSEKDARAARNNGAREAWGYKVQGAQGRMDLTAARQRRQGVLVGSTLTAAGQVAGGFGNYYAQQRRG